MPEADDADLADAVVLVTGATDGIGREAAVRFAARGAEVLLHGRDERKAEDALAAVRAASEPADGAVYLADFADPDAVRGLARAVRADHDGLDVLVNNAGTYQERRRTADAWTPGEWVSDEPGPETDGPDAGRPGVEFTFAVNHLAPFLLTNLLLDRLREGAPARVVTVSSELHRRGHLEDLELVVDPPAYDGLAAYSDSKLANLLFAVELAERLAGSGVAAHAVHPGMIPSTSLTRGGSGAFARLWKLFGLLPWVSDSTTDGGRAVEYAATSSELDGETGLYLAGRSVGDPAEAARDGDLRRRLWERSADLCDLPADGPHVPPDRR